MFILVKLIFWHWKMKLYKNHKKSSYSLAVPVINIFGFMYLSLKHLVDRYNLYYAYLPSRKVIFLPKLGQKGLIPGQALLNQGQKWPPWRISKRIVDRAIEITMMAVRMGLMFILFFTLLRYDIGKSEIHQSRDLWFISYEIFFKVYDSSVLEKIETKLIFVSW